MARSRVAFISYARRDGESFATSLRQRLEKEHPDITLWHDRANMAGGEDFLRQIREAIDEVRFLILVQTPAALESEWVQKEWRYAREQGVCVCPVKRGPDSPELAAARARLPKWISQAHAYDLDLEWDQFVLFLKSPCAATRQPFMPPDLAAGYVPRPAELAPIRNQAIENGNPSARTIVLYGSPGYGKTMLALSLGHDPDVITACDGGVLWVTLGERPSVTDELKKIYAALTGERPQFVDETDALIAVSRKLAGKRCLMVIDDAWEIEHLRPFLRGGEETTRIVTTRVFRVANEAAASSTRFDIGEMNSAEAVRLLLARIEGDHEEGAAKTLADRLGRWPLLLGLANGALREQIALGESIGNAIDWVSGSLGAAGVAGFDPAVARSLEISLNLLKEHRERCIHLGVFAEDIDIPLAVAQALWQVNERETQQIAQRIHNLSLARLDLGRRTLRLHDAMRAYFAGQLQDAPQLHGRVCDAILPPRNAGAFGLRFSCYHLVEAMRDPALALSRGRQLLSLLDDPRYRQAQHAGGDLVELNRQLAPMLTHAARGADVQMPGVLAALALAREPYTVGQQVGRIFDLARTGDAEGALDRLEFVEAEPEWRTAAILLIAWLARQPALTQRVEKDCNRPDLRMLLGWVRKTPPPAAQPEHVDLHTITAILQRAGGVEGSPTAVEPLNLEMLAASGVAPDVSGFIAEADGPLLVAFARKDPANTVYLDRYIAIHASNKYRYYRNRSLLALLKPVLEYPDEAWVRRTVEQLVTAALTETPIEFREAVPLAVRTVQARQGDAASLAAIDAYRHGFLAAAQTLSPGRGKGDNWSYFQRRAVALAEVYHALGRPDVAVEMLDAARDLPKGFAGFRAYSALALAEAAAVVTPADLARIDAALESARAAGHRIQDHPFCYQTTAMANAIRIRWRNQPIDAAAVIAHFIAEPLAPEFCAIHLVGDPLEHRRHDFHTLPIPESVRNAHTLRALAALYGLETEELERANAGNWWTADDPLPPGAEVNIPDPDFTPILAARLSAATTESAAIQLLVPLAASNPTTLDTVLSRLLLAARDAPLPAALVKLQTPEPQHPDAMDVNCLGRDLVP